MNSVNVVLSGYYEDHARSEIIQRMKAYMAIFIRKVLVQSRLLWIMSYEIYLHYKEAAVQAQAKGSITLNQI